MRRKRLIEGSVLTTIAIVGFAVFAFRPREPVYQGKSLSTWLVEANRGPWPRHGRVPADEAIRNIGTNAFPKIIELLRTRDSVLKTKLTPLVNRQSLFPVRIRSQYEHQSQAIAACFALGPIAKPLVPEVAKAFPHMKGGQAFAEHWLVQLGPDAEAAIPALIAKLKDNKNPIRHTAALPLAYIAIHQRREVVPVLNECLKDPDNRVRFQAEAALKLLNHEADKAAALKKVVP